MVRAFCTSGNHERVKCGVHGAAGALVALCALYNLTACWFRKDRHLRINALVYSLATAWELKQTLHHLAAVRGPADAGHDGGCGSTTTGTEGKAA